MGSHFAISGMPPWKAVETCHLADTGVVFREGVNALQLAGKMQGGKRNEASKSLHQMRCHLLGAI